MNSKSFATSVLLGSSLVFFSGCATIVHNHAPQNFSIISDPSQAKVVIVDTKNNSILLENQTPLSIALRKKHRMFSGKEYIVKVSKEGFKDIEFSVKPAISGWYIGNILFGGLIGILIVDPATGAMWNLKPEQKEGVSVHDETITIKLFNDLNDTEKQNLIPIK